MKISNNERINDYLSGKILYGDDLSYEQIKDWYKDEEEGYANLGSNNKEKYSYQYTAMNELYGFKYIDKNRKFKNALGFGSAFGHEFLPIIQQIEHLTIIEPSEQLISKILGNIEPNYVKPNILGNLDFPDNSFDFIVSFSVLHHIPNVSYVMSELIRVLKPNGMLLIREPIVSMGDWRMPRKGLTKNERGIPLSYFEKIIE
ncbi:MAG: class I SAM-dependent methyltransferase [Bacteroidetes bacterium]|nr:class I SAM-dependent methyltransferase [Bacteroidota bacterium]